MSSTHKNTISVVLGDDANKYDNPDSPLLGKAKKYTQLEVFNGEDDYESSQSPHAAGWLSCLVGTMCWQLGIFSCYTVSPKEEAVLLDYGKYNGTEKEPGCHYVCFPGRTLLKISTKVQSIEIPATKTIDKNGNPLIINGILAYQVQNSRRALFEVENYSEFVWTQSVAAMKQIVGRYPYEDADDVCLKNNADMISKELVTRIQQRVKVAGIEVISFTFNEISYAVEIASVMLKKQQAQAVLSARSVIVRGAVGIAGGAVNELVASGVALDASDKVQIVSNLLIVTCSDHGNA